MQPKIKAGSKLKVTGKLTGVNDVLALLAQIKKQATQVLRRAMTTESKPFLVDAKAGVPKRFGLLARSLKRKTAVNKKTGNVTVIIGPAKGAAKDVTLKANEIFRSDTSGRTLRILKPTDEQRKLYRNPLRYAHLIEYGTSHRKAIPFLRPAFDANSGTFMQRVAARLRAHIEKLASKKGGKK
jgi:HK97 gp10 family phage protein